MKKRTGFRLIGILPLCFLLVVISSCKKEEKKTEADIILFNGQIFTVDSNFTIAEAIAIRGDSILAIGSNAEIRSAFRSKQTFDLEQKSVYPGFIDAHCHFFAYGQDLQELDLKGCYSFDDMIEMTVDYAKKNQPSLIIGRGFNEEEWETHTTLSRLKLDALFPDIPVVLQRVDGHALLCNQVALTMAGIDENTIIEGGSIAKMGGMVTGFLVDKAAEKVLSQLPELSLAQKIKALKDAEKACVAAGLTTVSDAGLELKTIRLIDSLQKNGDLKIRVYAMANPNMDELKEFFLNGPYITDRLIARSVKLYCDGSLGSRGALLKKEYCDQPGTLGLLQNPISFYEQFADFCLEKGLQVNTHCIGDSANLLMLRIYGSRLHGANDYRWRIEHAQVVDPVDRHYFSDFNIIPSVQPTHATSDMYMARERLCTDNRLKGAYAYKSLLALNHYIAFGTDFPVESIDPLNTYLAATTRMGNKGEVFQVEEAVNFQDAIRAMTCWAAKANFMEKEVGILKPGMKADLVVVSNNLQYVRDRADARVMMTILNGDILHLTGIQALAQEK
ncbi:MAG: amidohydrolase family protein [Bacteroidetes bacterium]|nr:amidohydrolase family protein [Bacteroidota bacterium]